MSDDVRVKRWFTTDDDDVVTPHIIVEADGDDAVDVISKAVDNLASMREEQPAPESDAPNPT
jgi:hypothetical protein